ENRSISLEAQLMEVLLSKYHDLTLRTRVFLVGAIVVVMAGTIMAVTMLPSQASNTIGSFVAGQPYTQATTSSGDTVINGVDQQQLQSCLARPPVDKTCEQFVSGLAKCEANHELCNIAFQQQVASQFPSAPSGSQAHTSNGGLLTLAQAIQSAQQSAFSDQDSSSGLIAHTAAALPTYAEQTTYQDASNLFGEVGNALVDPNTPVFVVTVDVHLRANVGLNAGNIPPKPKYGMTAIYDAVNGKVIDFCLGCRILNASNTAPSTTQAG
ncbi:MAG TPA: hypothetical protein VMU77_07370, partial [Acidimicrobiales bacterium]|nr:hypothetical protein [Acidimicrobiales bacterium]